MRLVRGIRAYARHDGQITRFGAAHTGYIGDVCVGLRRRALHIVR